MKKEVLVPGGSGPSPRPGEVPNKAPPASKALRGKKAAVLDMGEASREEGFRLNGCR